MAYSARLRKAIGAVRLALESSGLGMQSPEFARHGEHQAAPDAPLVLVACSGGRDSMALAAVCRIVCASLGLRCGAVIVDHGLQSGSDRVATLTAERCRDCGLAPVAVRTASVHVQGEGVEAAAREARYGELCGAARELNAAVVLLAHTLDDQAETVLIGLSRSGGVDALAGMPQVMHRDGIMFLRPLIGVSRAETTGICEDLNIHYWDDPTNGDDVDGELPRDYPLRSRIRHDLLPAIERFAGADVTQHIANGARLARLDKEYLDQQADKTMIEALGSTLKTAESQGTSAADMMDKSNDLEREPSLVIVVKPLQSAHEAIRLRTIAHALSRAGISASSAQIEAINRLVVDWHGQGAVALPSGYSAKRQKHVIRVCQDRAHANR